MSSILVVLLALILAAVAAVAVASVFFRDERRGWEETRERSPIPPQQVAPPVTTSPAASTAPSPGILSIGHGLEFTRALVSLHDEFAGNLDLFVRVPAFVPQEIVLEHLFLRVPGEGDLHEAIGYGEEQDGLLLIYHSPWIASRMTVPPVVEALWGRDSRDAVHRVPCELCPDPSAAVPAVTALAPSSLES